MNAFESTGKDAHTAPATQNKAVLITQLVAYLNLWCLRKLVASRGRKKTSRTLSRVTSPSRNSAIAREETAAASNEG